MTSSPSETSVRYVKGVGPRRAEILEKLGIKTAEDLIRYFPRDYIDRSAVVPIGTAKIGATVTVKATVVSRHKRNLRAHKTIVEVELDDGSGIVYASWFNQPYMYDRFNDGDTVLAYGRISWYEKPQMVNPEFDIVRKREETVHHQRIVPVYRLTEGISQRLLREIIAKAVTQFAPGVTEPFSTRYLQTRGLIGASRAIENIHFPRSWEIAGRARKRLAYDELFLLQTAMALRRREMKEESSGIKFTVNRTIDSRIRKLFPFKLTASQEKAIQQILSDMCSEKPMNRIVQGEVGSGKTVVALYAMLTAVANGYQVAMMAPTEILAEQHFRTVSSLLEGSRVNIDLLVGGSRGRKEILSRIESGKTDIVAGTHALIVGDVKFSKPGLIVVDEQHKFGVAQRGELRDKANNPDVLVMTATPIPRTLALTVFGDLDVTTIKELPSGRRPIVTRIVPKSKRHQAYSFIRKHLEQGRQAYFVCPLVEESEKLNARSATETYERLSRDIFPEMKLGLLHGQMKSSEKEKVMRSFADRETDMLVATTVIEVGIDVSNATIMVIENAERFGLSQLHQLRGRIGRGKYESYCLLFPDQAAEQTSESLQVIASTSDGFKIAEEDLRLRGPGEFFGTRQHGLPELTVADLGRDFDLLKMARRDAFRMVRSDPGLKSDKHRIIAGQIRRKYGDTIDLVQIG